MIRRQFDHDRMVEGCTDKYPAICAGRLPVDSASGAARELLSGFVFEDHRHAEGALRLIADDTTCQLLVWVAPNACAAVGHFVPTGVRGEGPVCGKAVGVCVEVIRTACHAV